MQPRKSVSPTARPEWNPNHPDEFLNRSGELPLRAELFFVAALLVFGGGAMLALSFGAPWLILVFALIGATLAIVPYMTGWARTKRVERPEVLTIDQYGANKSYPLEPAFTDEETGMYGEWDNAETPEQQEWERRPEQ